MADPGPAVVAAADVVAGGPALGAVVAALRAGLVVGIPTDTVYGVAVWPFAPGSTGRVFALKGRPADVALPVLVAGTVQAATLAAPFPGTAVALAGRFWPGPLTLVVGRRPGLGVDLGGDDTSIGLRRADHGVATTLTRVVGPLATTSANRHGSPPVTTAGELLAALPGVAVVVDGGRCEGAPSTVVDVRGSTPRLLRAGAAPWDEIGAGGGWGSSQSRPRI